MRPRVASLLPSTTEVVCALGAMDQLCGVSHECDWPPELLQRVERGELPVLTGARLGPPGKLGTYNVREAPCRLPHGSVQPTGSAVATTAGGDGAPPLQPESVSSLIDARLR